MVRKPELYLKRKFDDFLVEWKSNPRRLPLIIKGARQVGKTECVRHFANGRYESFIEINFVERPQFKAIVRDGYSVESIVSNITQIDSSIRFVKGNTLLFFDELQEFPEIATALKFFAQEGSYDVILSGSLLGVHYHRVESFSVGYQTSVELRSLDFEEFLWAHGYAEDQLNDVCRRLQARTALPEAINETYSRLFLDYCILGGMPDVLENYFLTKTFTGSLAIQRQILKDYRADIRKYCEGLDPVRIQNVFDDVPFQLAKVNKKFQISKVAPGARHKDYWGCVEWLEQAGFLEIVITGIEIASWGVDLPGKPNLIELIKAVCLAVPGLRIRLGSLEPVIVTPDGKASFLTVKRGPPTGAMSGVFYPCQTAQIPRGAKVMVYTDGITEAERANHAQYGEGRLLEFASACGERDVRSTTQGLLSAVDCFVDGAEQSDDITIMTIGMPA